MFKVTISFYLSIFQRKAPFKHAKLSVPLFQMFGEGLSGVLRHDFCPVRLNLANLSDSHDVHDVKLRRVTANGSEMENRLLENFAQCSNDGTLMEANGSLIFQVGLCRTVSI